MTEHFKSPWNVTMEHPQSNVFEVWDKEHNFPDTNSAKAGEATRRLIESAPEMYDILKDLVCCSAFNGELFEKAPYVHKKWTIARAILTKIEEAI